jgi:hypothetical protein
MTEGESYPEEAGAQYVSLQRATTLCVRRKEKRINNHRRRPW